MSKTVGSKWMGFWLGGLAKQGGPLGDRIRGWIVLFSELKVGTIGYTRGSVQKLRRSKTSVASGLLRLEMSI